MSSSIYLVDVVSGYSPSATYIGRNIAFLRSVPANTGTTQATRYNSGGTLPTSLDANLRNAISAVFEKSSIDRVFVIDIKVGDEDKIKPLLEGNNIFGAILTSDNLKTSANLRNLLLSLGATDGVAGSGTGVIFVPWSASTYAKPTDTNAKINSRICYIRTPEYTSIAMLIAKVLTSANASMWGNVIVDYVNDQAYTGQQMTDWGAEGADNVNSFSHIDETDGLYDPTTMSFNFGRVSDGRWLGNIYIADYARDLFNKEGAKLLRENASVLPYDRRGDGAIRNFVALQAVTLGRKGFIREIGEERNTDRKIYQYAKDNNTIWNYQITIPQVQLDTDIARRNYAFGFEFETPGQIISLGVKMHSKER